MTVRDYLRVLRERWRLVLGIVLLALVVGTSTVLLTTKQYQATAQIYVQANNTSSDAIAAYQLAAAAQANVATFADIVRSDEILNRAATALNEPGINADYFRSRITADAPASRALVNITATDTSAARSFRMANAVADAFINVIEKFSLTKSSTDKSVQSVTLHQTLAAQQPTSPVRPVPVVNISISLILGLLVGVSAAILREVLDNRIKSEERLSEAASAPVMGVIVNDPKASRFPIATRAGAHNSRAENFRQMRANLQFANVDVHPRVIAVTSSIPGEGKTSISINLASTLAESGFRVCLVDADLRRPTIATVLGLVGPVGLTNVLIQQIALSAATQQVTDSLAVLSSGPVPPNPSEVLSTSTVRTVIRALLDDYDYVIIDTAPLLPVADGAEVAALADGTLLVAQHKTTTDSQVKRAVQSLRRVDATVIGVVLNRVTATRGGPYGYSYYRYDRETKAAAKPRPRPPEEPGAADAADLQKRSVSQTRGGGQ